MIISYQEREHYLVARWLLRGIDRAQKFSTFDELRQVIEITDEHEVLALMLKRARDAQAMLFPRINPRDGQISWMLTAPTLYQMEQARVHLQHLLVPAYTKLPKKVAAEAWLQGAGEVFQVFPRLYPYGYYRLDSRQEYTPEIYRLLKLWQHLEKERPAPAKLEPYPTYGNLSERFQLALAGAQWEEAEYLKREIQRYNLTSAENVLFLEIESLAAQRRWSEIRRLDDFSTLAHVPVPRDVRSALLTAFHHEELLPKEQQGDWAGALEAFREHLPALGLLLSARLGLTPGPVIQLFAYNAVSNNDQAALQELLTVTSDQDALACVQQLLKLSEPLLPPVVEQLPEPGNPLQLAGTALVEANYERAEHYISLVKDDQARLVLLLQLSFYTRDAQRAEDALLRYWDVPQEQLAKLHQSYPFVVPIASDLTQMISGPHVAELASRSIKTWLDWLQICLEHPADEINLRGALEVLAQTTDERSWEPEKLVKFSDLLSNLVLREELVNLSIVRDALGKLVIFFVEKDRNFPQEDSIYQSIYESLYLALLTRPAHEEQRFVQILLRLSDARLRMSPGKCETTLQHLYVWAGKPLADMEEWVLDVYEMLLHYGLSAQQLAKWCRGWLDWLLFTSYSKGTYWQIWYSLAQVIQPGADILQELEQRLTSEPTEETVDILSVFKAGYKIGIYSLQEGAAQRARDILLKRNDQLDIEICTDGVLTEKAKALAQSAELVVEVVTALKHALTYGIGPFLKDRPIVYPMSSGSTSIIRAIEEYAAKSRL